MGCIYRAVNKVNGKSYVGRSLHGLERRREWHEATAACDGGCYFQKTLLKYGFENFEWYEVYSDVPEEKLNELEIESIEWFASFGPGGYNLTKGGEVGDTFSGRTHTEETKRKISAWRKGKTSWNKGKQHTEETKNKISKAHKGKQTSEETKGKISAAGKGRPAWNKGVPTSEETKGKISAATKGVPKSEETKRRMSVAGKGVPKSEEAKRSMSESRKGKHPTEEARKNMSKSHLGKKPTEEARKNMSKAQKAVRLRYLLLLDKGDA